MICPNCDFKFDAEGLLRCPSCGAEIVDGAGSRVSIDPPLVEVARGAGQEIEMIKVMLEGSGIEALLAGRTLRGSTSLEDPGGLT
jgi:hypothetical protein